jgi:hypothetical protein
MDAESGEVNKQIVEKRLKLSRTYTWDTHIILVSNMDVLHGHLEIVDYFGDQCRPEAL